MITECNVFWPVRFNHNVFQRLDLSIYTASLVFSPSDERPLARSVLLLAADAREPAVEPAARTRAFSEGVPCCTTRESALRA